MVVVLNRNNTETKMNKLLQTISIKAANDLQSLIEEGHDDILNAIHKMESEAQANDQKPKFSLGFKITLDLDKATFDCDLSWTLKQTLGVSHQIEDPNQPPLPGVGDAVANFATIPAKHEGIDSMTITSGSGESVTITKEDAKRIQKNLKKAKNN